MLSNISRGIIERHNMICFTLIRKSCKRGCVIREFFPSQPLIPSAIQHYWTVESKEIVDPFSDAALHAELRRKEVICFHHQASSFEVVPRPYLSFRWRLS